MKHIVGRAGLALLIIFAAGCKQQPGTVSGTTAVSNANSTPADAVRVAIDAHIAHNGNLRRESFDTEVKQLTFDGDHAQAQVEFRAKNGPGTMQLTYSLEKRNGVWAVAESSPSGSNFSHPTAGVPAQNTPAPSVGDPSIFQVLDNMHERPAAAKLPPGHPPINSNDGASKSQP